MTTPEGSDPPATGPTLRVRVAIPHFFRETSGGTGYGSGRPGARFARSLALGRCLGALLALERSADDLVLNIGQRRLERSGALRRGERALGPIALELHLFTCGDQRLQEVLEQFADRLRVHELGLEDPRQLPLATRDWLIQSDPLCDLVLYLEDDLVIGDPLFFDKQAWFLAGCRHQAVLMPHRYERIGGRNGQRLLVDGPLRPAFIRTFCTPTANAARGRFREREVVFDQTDNPHSGLFCISGTQARQLATLEQPTDGFVSPLETAATLTVLRHYMVLKPSWNDRDFLWIEHGHPSFQNYCNQWPKVGEPV